ncbi:hypothetical protein LIA77_11453 [Sarocladium implicatum]|nr:hypothetical protein LIA77_11453 [Sarocladium implicatum]
MNGHNGYHNMEKNNHYGGPQGGYYNQAPPNGDYYNQGPPPGYYNNQAPPNGGYYNQGPPPNGGYHNGPGPSQEKKKKGSGINWSGVDKNDPWGVKSWGGGFDTSAEKKIAKKIGNMFRS